MLSIRNLSVAIEGHTIINNLSLDLAPGSFHALMGPNGSGKSTLAHAIAGSPFFTITAGSIIYNGTDITQMPPHERARKGIFISFQQPPAIPGLTVFTLLKEMYSAINADPIELELLHMMIVSYCQFLKLDHSFLDRNCNDGFSGGEKKRLELLQLLVLKPSLIILDEIDSGLDIDGLKLIEKVITRIKKENKKAIILLISHAQKVLNYLNPDQLHILIKGQIKDSGDHHLIATIEKDGYGRYL